MDVEMETIQAQPGAQPAEVKPKTKKVRMPDGEIKIKVQQPDGTWKWQKNEAAKKAVTKPAASSAVTTSVTTEVTTQSAAKPTTKSSTVNSAATKSSTFPLDKKAAASKKPAPKKKSNLGRNVGGIFRAAKILDAVLPEHLKLADNLAEDLGFDKDDDNHGSKGGHPTAASSRELAKLAAGGIKTKSKRAKRSVYRPGEKGSSDEESDLDEKLPSASVDTISTVKERSTTTGSKAFDEKTGLEISEKEIKPVKKRSSKGRRLQRRTSRLAQGVAWSIALFFPLLFMILAVINATQDNKSAIDQVLWDKNTLGKRLLQVNKVCVSMWPILFGAIVAQSFKMYAAWKVERGIKLITLEQLIGSHSLATAIKQPFFLQTINLTALGMIALWALSPLAGQSFLRMLSLGDLQHNFTSTAITYPDFTLPLTYAFEEPAFSTNKRRIDLNFATAFLAETTLTGPSIDPWQNPTFTLVPYDWSHIPVVLPSTYVGLPFMTLPIFDYDTTTYQNMTFSTDYSWFDVRCDPPFNTTIDALNAQASATLQSNDAKDNWFGSTPAPANDPTALATLYYAQNHTVGNVYPYYGGLAPTNETSNPNVTAWKCSYFTQYARLSNFCWTNNQGGRGCQTELSDHLPNSTNIFMNNVFTEAFVNTPVFQGDGQMLYWHDSAYDQYAVKDFSNALTTYLNAYWQVGFDFGILNDNRKDSDVALVQNIRNATAHVWEGRPVYQVSWIWLSILFIACILLIVFGVTGIILDSQTMGPDIIGFASSLTRDNRYIKLAEEDVEHFGDMENADSSKNAYESIRDMKHHKVMLQDVRGHEDVGKIALGSVGVRNGRALQRDRLYR